MDRLVVRYALLGAVLGLCFALGIVLGWSLMETFRGIGR